MEHVDLRLETVLKSFIEERAEKAGRTASEVARDLAWVGLGVQKEGGIEIEGPLRLGRLLAAVDLSREKEKAAFWINEELIKELKTEFRDNARSALRQAIHLRTLVCVPGIVRIRGSILGLERPLATIRSSEIKDEGAKQALARLQQ
jgi:hypothetical protein